MKKCPQCGREYDTSMAFCLDDGSELLYGPASTDEPATAILSDPSVSSSDSATRSFNRTTASEAEPPLTLGGSTERQSLSAHRAAEPKEKSGINKILLGTIALAVVALGGFLSYRYFNPTVSAQI